MPEVLADNSQGGDFRTVRYVSIPSESIFFISRFGRAKNRGRVLMVFSGKNGFLFRNLQRTGKSRSSIINNTKTLQLWHSK